MVKIFEEALEKAWNSCNLSKFYWKYERLSGLFMSHSSIVS